MQLNVLFGLYGTGGFGREVMPLISGGMGTTIPIDRRFLHFIETKPERRIVNRIQVLTEEEFFSHPVEEKYFNIAIANSRSREMISNSCLSRGAKPTSIVSPHAIVCEDSEIGVGSIICSHSIITSNAQIGRYFHCNIYSYVAHDCKVGDFVTFAPKVSCNGNIHIGDHAYIGTGALLKQGSLSKPLKIGEGAVVGMGAVVTKDVAPYSTVVGNPARELKRQ